MKKENIVIFSSIDWNDNWQIHQKLAKSLSLDNKVLFVENTGTRNPRISDYKRVVKRVKVWFKSIYGFKELDKNLTLYSPIALPFPYIKIFQFINIFLIGNPIKKWLKISNFNNPIVINFLPTPIIISQINKINPKTIVYYCADNMSESTIIKKQLKKSENLFIRQADQVIVTAVSLKQKIEKINKKVVIVPCGVDINVFNWKKEKIIFQDIKNIANPIIGYIGAISDVIDINLIENLAKKFQKINFVFIGNVTTNINQLMNIDNIYFIGEKNNSIIPHYVTLFDIGIIPYKKTKYMDSVYPCKLNEYLAMGIHVISVNIKEVEIFYNKYPNIISITNNNLEFENSIKNYLKNKDEIDNNYKLKRIEIAQNNSWDQRFKDIQSVIETSIFEKIKFSDNSWKNKLSDLYKDFYKKLFRKALIVSLFIFVTFYSPLFNIIGDQLVFQDKPKKSDAIVVFSGDGSSTYVNPSYQLRALDAVNYYKEGFANKIFISSGKEQAISEVEIIRLYLINQGIRKENINILEKYPSSTFENVILVNKSLKKKNIKSIIFLTAPYHGLRAKMLWNKNATNIQVNMPPVNDTPENKYKFGIKFNKIKIICYEFLSIIYNWYLGRI